MRARARARQAFFPLGLLAWWREQGAERTGEAGERECGSDGAAGVQAQIATVAAIQLGTGERISVCVDARGPPTEGGKEGCWKVRCFGLPHVVPGSFAHRLSRRDE